MATLNMDTKFHIGKAERNEQFFQSNNLRTSPFNEWGVTVLFYAAMHYVDAILAQESRLPPKWRQPHNHPNRNTGVAKSTTLGLIYNNYKNLYDRSIDARYTHISFPHGFLNNLETVSFEPVKRCVKTALALP